MSGTIVYRRPADVPHTYWHRDARPVKNLGWLTRNADRVHTILIEKTALPCADNRYAPVQVTAFCWNGDVYRTYFQSPKVCLHFFRARQNRSFRDAQIIVLDGAI